MLCLKCEQPFECPVKPAPVVLDFEKALASCGEADFARSLIDKFRLSLVNDRTELIRLRERPGDWNAIRDKAHHLQSGGAYLGLERIAASARDLENCLLTGAPSTVREQALATLLEALQAFLAYPPHSG